ncbi:hypothetical protein KP509_1Z109700 [Ceratopteris richardii]|nr:hypothetical protein KP509_1Z109700 [Ceratopteris richardii]
MGMHIDRMEVSSTEGRNQSDTQEEEFEGVSSARTKLNYGVRHVLILSFSPSVTTKDLEDLFEPFVAANGVAIRWVNDTTALAIFRNPETAKEALRNTKNPSFKIEQLADDEPLLGLINEKDLQPPVPRPATTSQAAHRMIMGALQRQGLQKKTSSTLKRSQQQESERKQRILTRQRLRDEAWGSEV